MLRVRKTRGYVHCKPICELLQLEVNKVRDRSGWGA